ncbi:MAG: LLM class flavin-dependent oxidoreductase [Acetobacteraceae bacterium]|nr:LLM class flavin-dependent oxidoreductase [Acetobacteraceae bacterium]
MKFGITLANRGILLGLSTVPKLLALTDAIEANPALDSVWVGDALFVNQRLDALTLLGAIAGRTSRVRLGPACMGTFALRDPRVFAYEWASLDVISGGRTILCVCSGGGSGPAWNAETEAMGIPPAERRKRMIENIHVLRHLWTTNEVPFEGTYLRFGPVTMLPKPLQSPCPIWLTTNAGRLDSNQVGAGGSDFSLRRVGRVADGWMTHSVTPEGFRRSLSLIEETGRAAGRDMAAFGNIVTAVLNIQDDAEVAMADAKQYLDLYYGADYSRERLDAWGPIGTPAQCAAWIRRFAGSGCQGFTFRLATRGDAMTQLRRLTEEVLPLVQAPS